MRKVPHLEEQILKEFLDKMLKGIEVVNNSKSKGASYKFTFEGDDPKINPNPFPITYTVSFSRPKAKVITVDGHPSMKVMTSELTFSNNKSDMSTMKSKGFQDVNSSILFSSVAAIVLKFFDTQNWADAINFVPAHEGLFPAYKILSMEASKKGDLVWTNPSTNRPFFLVRGSVYKEFLRILGA